MRRWLVLESLPLAILVAGCGSAREPAAPAAEGPPDVLQAAPPIVAVDEPVAAVELPRGGSRKSVEVCWDKTGPLDCATLPEADRQRREEVRQRGKDGLPAAEPDARIVALLRRAGAADVAFVVYRSAGRGLCWNVVSHTGQDPAVVFCEGDAGSAALSIRASSGWSEGEPSPAPVVVSGTVAADADSLRLRFGSGPAFIYPLAGPLVPGLPKQRVVIVANADGRWPAGADLLRGGDVIASESYPGAGLATGG